MTILLFSIFLILIYFFFPKGNPVYEGLHLLTWWVKMWRIPSKNQKRTKISYGDHSRQYFLLFEPNKPITKNNIIFYIHGGGWQFGSPDAFSPHAQFLTNQGYAVIMPSHRRVPFSDYENMREDLDLLAKKALEIQTQRNWQNKNWIISGMSSGGNLAALFALNQQRLLQLNFPVEKIKGLLLIGAPLDLNKMYISPNLLFFAGRYGSEKFKKANPINYITSETSTPILIIHGTKDGLVHYKSMLPFYEKVKKEAVSNCQLITLKNGIHLNAASWTFKDCEFQPQVLDWLQDKEM